MAEFGILTEVAGDAMSSVERAYRGIRQGIIDGAYRPGVWLREAALADRLNVSRTPVREALRRLEMEGIIRIVPNHGAQVVSWTHNDLDELFMLRDLLECKACEIAATAATTADIDAMSELAEAMIAANQTGDDDRLSRISHLNSQFHRRILDAAKQERLATAVQQVVEMPIVLKTYHRYAPSELARSLMHHVEIVDAFRARDGNWAAAAMRSHIRAAYHAVGASL